MGIWYCHCWDIGLTPGPGNFQKKKKKKKRERERETYICNDAPSPFTYEFQSCDKIWILEILLNCKT